MTDVGWSAVPEEVRLLAESVLTAKQLDVLKLHEAGLGYGRISLIVGVAPSTVRGHLQAAARTLEKALRAAA